MMAFKSTPSRLAKIFQKSRDKWRKSAIERRKKIRMLELKIRDLEISRAKWKEKAQATSKCTDPIEKKDTDEKETGKEEAEIVDTLLMPPAGHHYPVATQLIAIQSQVEGMVSLRATEQIFQLFSPYLPEALQSAPDHSTVQSWVDRVGLYLLNEPVPKRDDWIYVMDHFLERGTSKCLIILGIPLSRLAEQSYSPSHKAMKLLMLEVIEHSCGELVQEQLERVSQRVGVPIQIVSDHGPDLVKGINLFCADHPETIYTYDISHQLGVLLKAEVNTDPIWNEFQQKCNGLRKQLQQTEWQFLMPPAQRTKGRFMAMERIEWLLNLVAYADRGDFSQLKPAYSIDWACREEIERQFGSKPRHAVLCYGPVGTFSDSEVLGQKIASLIESEEPLSDEFWRLADERRRRFNDFFGELLKKWKDFIPYAQFLALTKCAQNQLKKEGVHANSGKDLVQQFQTLPIVDSRVARFRDQIVSAVVEQADKIPKGRVGLASSDICESVIGKEKLFSKKSPLQEIGKSILKIPIFLTNLTEKIVRKGLETVRNRDLKEWSKETLGDSAITKRRKAFKEGFDDTYIGGSFSLEKG